LSLCCVPLQIGFVTRQRPKGRKVVNHAEIAALWWRLDALVEATAHNRVSAVDSVVLPALCA
jgi:hypothetical protein